MRRATYEKLAKRLDDCHDILSYVDTRIPEFHKMVKLGIKVIPLLLQDILCGKDPHWRFAAICKIAEKEKLDQVVIPEEDEGYVDRMIVHYLKWGFDNGFISMAGPVKSKP